MLTVSCGRFKHYSTNMGSRIFALGPPSSFWRMRQRIGSKLQLCNCPYQGSLNSLLRNITLCTAKLFEKRDTLLRILNHITTILFHDTLNVLYYENSTYIKIQSCISSKPNSTFGFGVCDESGRADVWDCCSQVKHSVRHSWSFFCFFL